MARRQDVRVIKTKNKLHRAVVELLKTKGIDELSISEVCTKAEVNRNTFYSHYSTIQDIFDEVKADYLSHFLSDIEEMRESGETTQKVITYFLQSISVNRDFFALLFSDKTGIIFLNTIIKLCLKGSLHNTSITSPIITEDDFFVFIVGGVSSLIIDWIGQKDAIDAKEMGAKISFFIYNIRNNYY